MNRVEQLTEKGSSSSPLLVLPELPRSSDESRRQRSQERRRHSIASSSLFSENPGVKVLRSSPRSSRRSSEFSEESLREGNFDKRLHRSTVGLVDEVKRERSLTPVWVTIPRKGETVHSRSSERQAKNDVEHSTKRREFAAKISTGVLDECRQHSGEETKLFCAQCNVPVCCECLVEHHNGHFMCRLREKAQSVRRKIKNRLRKMEGKIQGVKDVLSAVRDLESSLKEQRDTVEKGVNSAAQKLIELVRKQQGEIVSELDAAYMKEQGDVKSRKEELEKSVEKLSQIHDKIQEDLGAKGDLDIVLEREQVLKDVEKALEQADVAGQVSEKVLFNFDPSPIDEATVRLGQLVVRKGERSSEIPTILVTETVDGGMGSQVASHDDLIDDISSRSLSPVPPTDLQFGVRGDGEGELNSPWGVAVSDNGDIYVVENLNKRVQVFNVYGQYLRHFSTAVPTSCPSHPVGVAVGPDGKVLVADGQSVKVYAADGTFQTSFGEGLFEDVWGVVVDGNNGRVIVTDIAKHRVTVHDASGALRTQFGSEGSGPGMLSYPYHVTVNAIGDILVSDSGNNCVKLYDSTGKFRLQFGQKGKQTGQFLSPRGICADRDGQIIVADSNNKRIQMFDSVGEFSSVITTETYGIQYPRALALTPDDRLVVTDSDYCTVTVMGYMSEL
ncbi:PREDICTED: E3 ubiquitin-protein ligase TRIM71-like [Branchiostoma belcheri]|uniref:E3 ubiquitin-protein ligase TRIM71-like n=1 Tax=Branchiostoma belcheri TaxID=7741 RepID=A0A6P4Y3V0_BRABE|nr:PREDICTED: E3 ubiquitin-protein ligase TRIM71-like [Branchiostoma belcheri]